MVIRSFLARKCARFVFLFVAFLLCGIATINSASAQGQGSFALFLYDAPAPPYEVTNTYVNGHVTDKHNNIIYITLDYDGSVIYDLQENAIGYFSPATTFQPTPTAMGTLPSPLFALWTVERLLRQPEIYAHIPLWSRR